MAPIAIKILAAAGILVALSVAPAWRFDMWWLVPLTITVILGGGGAYVWLDTRGNPDPGGWGEALMIYYLGIAGLIIFASWSVYFLAKAVL